MFSFVSPLYNKSFRNLWFGQILSQIAVNMMAFVLILSVYAKTHSNTAVSGIALAIGLPAIIVGIVAGGVVDSFDKKWVLVWSNVLRVFIFLLFFFFYPLEIAGLYIMASFFSIVTQFFIPAEGPSIPSFVNKSQLLSANSLFTFSLYAATVIGFVSTGPILSLYGEQSVYMFMAVLMAGAAVFTLLLPSVKPNGMRKFRFTFSHIKREIDEGLLFIFRNERVRHSLLLMTFSQALLATLAILAPGFADQTLNINLNEVSYVVMGPATAGLIVGALWVGTKGKNYLKRILVLMGVVGTGVMLVLLSFLVRVNGMENIHYRLGELPLGGVEVAALIIFLLGFMIALISVPAATVIQEATEGRMRGRIYGALTSLTGGAAVLPVVFSGILADTIGITKTLLLLGFLVLLYGVYRMILLNRVLRGSSI